MRITEPWLIQRGSFKDVPEIIAGIDSIISWDYMGSSEFEWGTLPSCLKGLISAWSKYRVYQHPTLRDMDDNPCYFFCQQSDKQAVIEVLVKLSNHEYRLKEYSDFDNYIKGSKSSREINFWWALETESLCGETLGHTQWMACFGHHIATLIKGLIAVYTKKTDTVPSDGIVLDAGLKPEVHDRELYIEDDRKVIKVKETFTDRETVLVKSNLLETNIAEDKIFVKIKTRGGAEKWINIVCKNEKRKKQLYETIKENIEIRNIRENACQR